MEAPLPSQSRLHAIRRGILHVMVGCVAASLAGAEVGLSVAVAVRGRNVSDVGVPLWEHGDLAFAAGAAAYLAVVLAGWFLGRLLADPVPPAAVAAGWVVRGLMGAAILLTIRVSC